MDETGSDGDDYDVFALWTSGLPIEEILARELEHMKRRSPADEGQNASVIRDHTPGDLDEWLAGKDTATRPAPHEPRIVSWERH